MATRVGPKGQVVIEKSIRDQLGIRPGWRAVQRLVDDHVEVRFLPPEHTRSLAAMLSGHLKRTAPTEESLRLAREKAWAKSVSKRQRT